MKLMTMNVVNWECAWQYAQDFSNSLSKAGQEGEIEQLCIRPGGWACFRSEGPAHELLKDFSERHKGKTIHHEWANEEECGSSLWQEGRESRYIPPRESPGWDGLTRDVTGKVENWEMCAAFHNKLDLCWNAYTDKYRGLPMSQIQDRAVEIMATVFCYGQLRKLSWHKSWIALLNLLDDPLETVRDAWIAARGVNLEHNFEFDLSYIAEKIDYERSCSHEVEQSQSL